MRGYRKEWLKGEVALVPSGMMEGKRNLSLLDLRLWVGGGDSTGFEVGRRWRQRIWDGWPAVETRGFRTGRSWVSSLILELLSSLSLMVDPMSGFLC
nr:hypothetical protein CFP56_43058 [Quercus suber]